ncbi:pentatricopeptide repeat-containing protein, mitochondrial [Iris pallida]|uniref:Pentatricopeptide repeat-containing protein, mitochondrial n=1 Tax=Iris pallida TaxID=29817 RepID=A0AAX6HIN8_IRIPA|nr:pentatricopeptide repeat-containing protein, mitochondrial [Iris pallida]
MKISDFFSPSSAYFGLQFPMHAPLLPLTPKPTKPASSILVALLLRTGLDVPPALLSPSPPDPSPLNAALSAFARNNFPSLALRTFSLLHRLALPLDSYSLCTSLSASTKLPLPPAKQIHAIAHKSAHIHNVFVCGALLHSYSTNADSLRDARRLFDETPVRNTVCANTLLYGYVHRGLWAQGLSLVQAMQQASRLRPDDLTLSCVLRISGEAAAVEIGRQAHGYLIRSSRGGTGRDVVLLSCLVEMYGRCGLAGKARLVFETGGVVEGGKEREGCRSLDFDAECLRTEWAVR